ncbi:hypothetical protein A2V56_04310 [Candidatus Woesebacteria bacterium RBG_19FT_COMBO_42_9]|uniref:F-type ATPase subunit delta n=1 Tax=Candidatus Woesebacteria bacterium RBG_16_42_24 TaxID=1802485 RepID=A0A1F7XJK8_9BACT|nr:MAG: hypothetical protein A2V97_01055 [Candidatus Woesebacteria bacterium RBG_16_42_24]OGM17839.1 MAG: hypothetical protein A2V56_04310 [Candidatus Woesebacteria bacterium RBG_19FT_COMBO_42_9]OGM68114.1 MAG: hypothetical protein A2985_03555 [Candidatus Woesebacteria bacterium RIFCSPLOWO2_01_FULL_43_11]
MSYELVKLARTKDEALKLIDELDLIYDSLFENSKEPLDEVLAKKVSAKTVEIVKAAFSKGVDKAKYLKAAKELLRRAKIITLTLAFEPREETIEKLSVWISKNIEGVALLDITKNESLVGGAILIFQGNYRDFSLRKKIRDFLLRERNYVAAYLAK